MNEQASLLLTVGVVIIAGSQARATERYVPSPNYPTIQSAINACVDGDEVIIEPNTYTGPGNRDLNFGGRAITVRSIDPNDPNIVTATIIDCQRAGLGFYFNCGEGPNSVVAGLTITGGRAQWHGGGIYCGLSSPTITHCHIRDNFAWVHDGDVTGGGIWCRPESAARITHCLITGNWTEGYDMNISGGGGLHIGPQVLVSNCVIAGNSVCPDNDVPNHYGSAVLCYWGGTIRNCLITGNRNYSCEGFGAVFCFEGVVSISNCAITDNDRLEYWGSAVASAYVDAMTIQNCILWNPLLDEELFVYSPSTTVLYSDVRGGRNSVYVQGGTLNWGDGNIDADPLFVDPDGPDGDPNTWEDNDYHLSVDSPCITAGDPNGDYAGQTDIDGDPRVAHVWVDMGSDEYVGPLPYYALSLVVKKWGQSGPWIWGAVTVDPDRLVDPNDDPNDPNAPREYPSGARPVLTAHDVGNKVFTKWKLWDLSDANDANYPLIDTNDVLYLTMNTDWRVLAAYDCGGGTELLLLVTLGALGALVLTRRRA